MGTFVLCGVGVYLLVRSTRSWTLAAVSAVLALIWCLAMSFSRLYLGVHYASDVMAGMVAGAAWVAVCISALEMVHRRRGRIVPVGSSAPAVPSVSFQAGQQTDGRGK
jgi:undecaprenyl-diphosphatase